MSLGVKEDSVRRQGSGDICESKLKIPAFTRRQGVSQLILVEIDH